MRRRSEKKRREIAWRLPIALSRQSTPFATFFPEIRNGQRSGNVGCIDFINACIRTHAFIFPSTFSPKNLSKKESKKGYKDSYRPMLVPGKTKISASNL